MVKFKRNRSTSSGVDPINEEAREYNDCGAYKKLYEAYEYANNRD